MPRAFRNFLGLFLIPESKVGQVSKISKVSELEKLETVGSELKGEIIGEVQSVQLVDRGVNAGKEFQIHFAYYFKGTTKIDDFLHLLFED